MPTLVFIALALSGLAALVAGFGALALLLLGASAVWGFACGLVAAAEVIGALTDWTRRGGSRR